MSPAMMGSMEVSSLLAVHGLVCIFLGLAATSVHVVVPQYSGTAQGIYSLGLSLNSQMFRS